MIILYMAKKLSQKFFIQPTQDVAQQLLGKYLIIRKGKHILSGKIVETEAYIGESDLACHASKGRTPRTEMLYQKAGTVYVYLVYGMYYCLNIVTEHKDFPSAVLIRAIEPREGILEMQKNRKQNTVKNLASGPGKLCMAFGISKEFNGKTIFGDDLYIEDRKEIVLSKDIIHTKRIGVDYAKHCKEYPWRFYINNNHFISKK